MDTKKLSTLTENIQERFFIAIDVLVEKGQLFSQNDFCMRYGIERARYAKLRDSVMEGRTDGSYKYKVIDLDVLGYLVRDFKIPGDWLLTGKGRLEIKEVQHMTIKELHGYLKEGPSERLIRQWVKDNRIPHIKNGSHCYFIKEEIDKLIAKDKKTLQLTL